MTLFDIACITSASTLIRIVPNDNPNNVIDAYAISIRTDRPYHHPVVARYVNDHVVFIQPSENEPNIINIIVEHRED